MSVPPQLIRVKRKATEEAPVSYLRVQENKRHRSEVFVYRRQDERAAFADDIPQIQKPIVHTSQPSAQTPAFQSVEKQNTGANSAAKEDDTSNDSSNIPTAPGANGVGPATEPRRFHMSRKEMMLAAYPHPSRTQGGISKKRSAPALFVERKIKRISSRIDKLNAANNGSPAPSTPTPASVTEDMDVDKPEPEPEPEPRKFKKPGVAKLAAKSDTPKYKADVPKAMTERWNVDMDKLTAEMDAYAMEQIGLNLQKAEDEKQRETTAKQRAVSNMKFKPKAPAKRYAERHPEEAQTAADKDMVDADVDNSDGDGDGDDGDYIIETYVRVPASKMGENVPPQTVGLLVFDAEPDLEFFYGEGDDSEDEWAEDEEDENAENYYRADYPDEEVASDDEYNQNPYSYRTGNASDLEEYDVADDSDDYALDDQDEPGGFKAYIGRDGLRTNHL